MCVCCTALVAYWCEEEVDSYPLAHGALCTYLRQEEEIFVVS